MRRAAVAAILLAQGLAVPIWSAECQCLATTPQDRVETATAIFRGPLDEIQNSKKEPVRYIFVVNDTFKGDASATEFTLQDADAGTPCALALEKDKEYLVYARWQWGSLQTSRCWGTKPVTQAEADRAAIGPGDLWKAKVYTRLHEACLGTYETPCCLQAVKAMEKGRFLPEPDGGCAEGQRPNVANCKGSLRWCEPIVDYHP